MTLMLPGSSPWAVGDAADKKDQAPQEPAPDRTRLITEIGYDQAARGFRLCASMRVRGEKLSLIRFVREDEVEHLRLILSRMTHEILTEADRRG